MYNASLERDENFVPQEKGKEDAPHSESAMEDAPFYTLGRLLVQQIIGLHLYFSEIRSRNPRRAAPHRYLVFNIGGQPHYPATTSHYNRPSTSKFSLSL